MKTWPIVVLLIAIVAVPFLLRPSEKLATASDHTLVIVSPHNEAIRSEFGRAFHDYYKRIKNEDVTIEWRIANGTSDATRYVESEYLAAFEYYWTKKLGKKFTLVEKGAFANPKIVPDASSQDDTPEEAARRAFLTSKISCGMDLFFGGGSFDFAQQAARGNLVDCGLLSRHPEWFGEAGIPVLRGGESYYDKEGRWFGACLSAFGICYNSDSLSRLGVPPPNNWADLADPRFIHQIALADPTKSGSITKAFEMIIQQQIHEATPAGPASAEQIAAGWTRALLLIQKIGANARYFTDAATKVPLDVASGDAAAGMCIDFYGRFQSEVLRKPDGTTRLTYVSPPNGTSVGSDPIGLLRGAPHPELARDFIEFVLSEEGQKLWNFKLNTPGGPARYQLRRLPIRPELYSADYQAFRTDPQVLPYSAESEFNYQPAWTGALFRQMGVVIRAMCIDPQEELQSAWQALVAAKFPPEASRVFENVSTVSYSYVCGPMKAILSSPNKIDEVRLAKELSEHFRNQYRETRRLADEGK